MIQTAKKVTILGGGAFGTAIAFVSSHNPNNKTSIWMRETHIAQAINEQHINPDFMSEIRLPDNIKATTDLEEALRNSDIILSCLPAQVTPDFLEIHKNMFDLKTPFVSCSKGMVVKKEKFISECINEIFHGKMKYCMLSGPSFAEEILKKNPTCVAIACKDHKVAEYAQKTLFSRYFRPYTQEDVIGVEIAGALKNVLAVGTGILEGLGFGYNTCAAFLTRGTKEMQDFAAFYNAKPSTLFGLAGIGDIMLTGFGKFSRNRVFGYRIGKGEKVDDILKTSKGVVEGLPTMEVVVQFAKKNKIDLPIYEVIYNLTHNRMTSEEALDFLMLRKLTDEYY